MVITLVSIIVVLTALLVGMWWYSKRTQNISKADLSDEDRRLLYEVRNKIHDFNKMICDTEKTALEVALADKVVKYRKNLKNIVSEFHVSKGKKKNGH